MLVCRGESKNLSIVCSLAVVSFVIILDLKPSQDIIHDFSHKISFMIFHNECFIICLLLFINWLSPCCLIPVSTTYLLQGEFVDICLITICMSIFVCRKHCFPSATGAEVSTARLEKSL